MPEDTIDNSQPIELYEFVGSSTTYRYTSDAVAHTVTNTYNPLAGLTRSSIKVGTHEDDKDEVSVSLPVSAQVAIDYAFQITPPRLKIIIRKLDRSGGGASIIWQGPVAGIEVKKHIAKFRCPSVFTNLLQSRVPTIMAQAQCNHVLYDSMCKLSRAANTYSATVTAVNGTSVTVNASGSFPDADYIGGEFRVVGAEDRRTITAKSGTAITLSYTVGSLIVGNTVELSRGCDHGFDSAQGCTKFSNKANFLGFHTMPGESNNVFRVGI